jgi:DNA repair photolyase
MEYRNPFSILTKGTLILRDLDLLIDASQVTDISTAFSVGTVDEQVWKLSEPGTPHPRKRLEAVRKLNDAGIPCGVMIAPVLPGISDSPDQLREVIEAAIDAGATHVSPILLHLRPYVKDVYMHWLGENYPDLVDRYETMYRNGAYASVAARHGLSEKVGEVLASIPQADMPAGLNRRRSSPPRAKKLPLKKEQLTLL